MTGYRQTETEIERNFAPSVRIDVFIIMVITNNLPNQNFSFINCSALFGHISKVCKAKACVVTVHWFRVATWRLCNQILLSLRWIRDGLAFLLGALKLWDFASVKSEPTQITTDRCWIRLYFLNYWNYETLPAAQALTQTKHSATTFSWIVSLAGSLREEA